MAMRLKIEFNGFTETRPHHPHRNQTELITKVTLYCNR